MSEKLISHGSKRDLQAWLSYIESIHSVEIDLGLTRVKAVADLLKIDFNFAKVITVAGTNGKGTTCAFLENALLDKKKRVAVYSSPHIERFNERLRIDKQEIDDISLINAFEKIERIRTTISLSYYEFTTLAAFVVLSEVKPEYIILEVGLGGRLDATNIIDADIAVITTIDLDHQSFLGNTREAIGVEKAGIFRENKRAIIGDTHSPLSVLAYARKINAKTTIRNQDFVVEKAKDTWTWRNKSDTFSRLMFPYIPIDNVATALSVLKELAFTLSVEKINQLIAQTRVAGRTELFESDCRVMLDVGHNPQAARYLADYLRDNGYRQVRAVVGMLKDKDIINTLAPLTNIVSHWYVGTLSAPRGAQAEELATALDNVVDKINCFDNVTQAFKMASKNAGKKELILVFGSFFTVAEIRNLLLKLK